MRKIKYTVKEAYYDPSDTNLYYEYTKALFKRIITPINDAELIIIESRVDDQVYYKKELKTKLKVRGEDFQFFYSEINECKKYWIDIHKECNDGEKFIYQGFFSNINIEFDLDACTCEIEVQYSSIYDCIEKNRNLKGNYLLDNGIAEAPQVIKYDVSTPSPETYRAFDLLDIVNYTLGLVNCRGYDNQKRNFAWFAVSDFFNWHKEKDHINEQGYQTISYLTTGRHTDGTLITVKPNYVNPSDNPYFIMIGTKSDTMYPFATNPATNWVVSFAMIEKMLREVFNVYWIQEPNLYVRFEHYSWFKKKVNYDSISATNFPFNREKKKFKSTKDDFPSSEEWVFNDHKTIDAVGKPIVYPVCSNGERKQRGDENVGTDLKTIWNKGDIGALDTLNKNGYFLFDVFATDYSTVPRPYPFYVVPAVGKITGITEYNHRLSVANLHYDLHRHNRHFKAGIMNGISETFLSEVYKKEQENIVVKLCCTDDFNKSESLVMTELGNGEITEAEINHTRGTIKFNLKHK